MCALLTKPERRRINLECRYIGFEIPNVFVVGYGLDWDEQYRTGDHVASFRAEAIPELAGA